MACSSSRMPFQMLSMAFHPLLITAERPGLGLITTIANAAANILLDWAFVAGFGWGMEGAAIAHTATQNGVPFVILRVISDLAEHQANVSFDELELYAGQLAGDITAAMLTES